MKVICAYRYGIFGGVSIQFLLRQTSLRERNIDCLLYFSQDNGLGSVASKETGTYFGADIGFRRLIKHVRPDAVMVVDSPELLILALGWPFSRSAVFLDVHTTTRKGLTYLHDIPAGRLAGISAPSRYSADLVAGHVTGAGITVLPNILNTSVFHPCPDEQGPGTGTREYIWVGKLDDHKNWRLALVYGRLLSDLFQDVRLTIIGGHAASGEQAEAFFQLAHQLDLLEKIRWIDRIDNTKLADMYRLCSSSGGAMIVTSRDESFGMAAAEALLCGCPLISNDLPVFREVFPSSPLVRLVDIWQPEQVAVAAEELSSARPTPAVVDAMYDELRNRYNSARFFEQFSSLLARA